jgi:hypothetical protein
MHFISYTIYVCFSQNLFVILFYIQILKMFRNVEVFKKINKCGENNDDYKLNLVFDLQSKDS